MMSCWETLIKRVMKIEHHCSCHSYITLMSEGDHRDIAIQQKRELLTVLSAPLNGHTANDDVKKNAWKW